MKINSYLKPKPPKELQFYQFLHSRKTLSTSETLRFDHLHKGYLGEQKLYHLLKSNPSDNRIAMFDLLLEHNDQEFQIDCLIITKSTIFLLEVKNFSGDYYFEDGKFYSVRSRKEIRNPLLQLQRTEFLLKQLLQNLNVHLTVQPYIIFSNEECTLYQVPLTLPIIFPTQLKRFIPSLHVNEGNLTDYHTKLANSFASMHKKQSIHLTLPEVNREQLKCGITCQKCVNFLKVFNHYLFKCSNCGSKEKIEPAVMRSVFEFHTLFPQGKITTCVIYEWIGAIIPRPRVRRILLKNMVTVGERKHRHYIFKEGV